MTKNRRLATTLIALVAVIVVGAACAGPQVDDGKRVVLAELYTGAECPPCVAADMAYDLLIEEYPGSEVAVIEFHEHIPGPDPMTNPDAVERMAFYTRAVIRGTPTVIMDGTGVDVGGGGASRAPNKLEKYKEMIGTAMKVQPSVGLGLKGSRRGNTVSATTAVVWRDASGREGHDLRLRVALVEREVDYTGGNGLERHAMVFRGFLTGQAGTALTAGTDARSLKNTVDIAILEKAYGEYLEQYLSENPDKFRRSDGAWRAMMNEIDEGDLALVAFVQDDTTKEVLQARVVDLD